MERASGKIGSYTYRLRIVTVLTLGALLARHNRMVKPGPEDGPAVSYWRGNRHNGRIKPLRMRWQ